MIVLLRSMKKDKYLSEVQGENRIFKVINLPTFVLSSKAKTKGQVALVVKNLLANSGDVRDAG